MQLSKYVTRGTCEDVRHYPKKNSTEKKRKIREIEDKKRNSILNDRQKNNYHHEDSSLTMNAEECSATYLQDLI